FALGEEYSNAKLVHKVLRSLLEHFIIKVIATKEAKDNNSKRIDELIVSLQMFRINEKLTLLTKSFNCVFKKLSEKSKGFERGHNFNKGKRNVGYDHTQVGCANALKNKMSLFIAWSDNASTSEHDEDEVHLSNYLACTSKVAILDKWDNVCKIKVRLIDDNSIMIHENCRILSEKLDEILSMKRREIGRGRLQYVDTRNEIVSSIVFVKANEHKEA
ncbi:hypothetical protein Gotur_004250, partial [Gossypium turneri]